MFVPSYNEEPELLAATIAAAKAMRYHRASSSSSTMEDRGKAQPRGRRNRRHRGAAQRGSAGPRAGTGAIYITRTDNQSAKAGNLTNGLACSSGELVAVFDADHAPSREFLLETVGFAGRDERLFLVQTPHFFLNPDPDRENLGTFKRMPSENEMFYGMIQKGLDKWNTSFFCGSAAVLRRAALDEVGGFSGMTITEDCETALELHSRGWNSLYVDKPLIAGLQPETFLGFIGQRSRWCCGMLQILMLIR